MSVLLEALKKAAENKKLGTDVTESVADVASADQAITKTTEPLEDEVSPIVDQNQVDLNKQPELKELNEDKTYSELQLVNEGLNSDSTDVVKSINDLELELSEENSLELDKASAKNLENVSSNESELESVLRSPYVDEENLVSISSEKAISEKLEETPPQLEEESLHKETAVENVSSDDSYSWSLSTLPGYDQDAKESQNINAKTVNVDSAVLEHNQILSSDKRFRQYLPKSIRSLIFGRSSNYAVYTLLSILMFSFLGLFGILYFQDQSLKLEQSMHKYDIVRLETVKPPIKTEKALKDSEKVASSSELNLVNEEQSETALIDSVDKKTAEVQPVKKVVHTKRYIKPKVQRPSVVLNVEAIPAEPYVQNAYQALYARNYDKAKELFNKAILENSENVDALNGLGAVYAQLNQETKALEQYYKVLEISSDDIHAYEAIISLMGTELSGQEWKSEIKRVLVKHPDSAILNYALGNIYAGEKDWDKAQSSYFNAHLLDEQNPDYLVNLAISLDHLGKYALAEKYYTLGLVHSESQKIYFDVEQVKLRLASIKQYIGQTDL